MRSSSYSLRRLWMHPRAWRPRGWLFTCHLWCGLLLGGLFLVVGVTGSLVVFKPEIELAMIRDIALIPPGRTRVSLQALYTDVRDAYPGSRFVNASLYAEPERAWTFRLSSPGGERVQVYVDQYRGVILGEDRFDGKWIQWIYELHADLLGGATGRLVNGVGALLFCGMCLTGLVIWWPGRRRIGARAFAVKWSSGWKGVAYDLHKSVGIGTFAVLLIVGVTGVYYAWPDEGDRLIEWMSGSPAQYARPMPLVPGSHAPLDRIVAAAAAAMPEGEPTILRFPGNDRDIFSLRLRLAGDWNRTGSQLAYVDPVTAQVLRVDRHDALPLGPRLQRAISPLHFGTFWGTPTRILWVLLGIVPGALWLTGVAIYWNRVLVKRLAVRRHAQVDRIAGPVTPEGLGVVQEISRPSD